MKLTKHQIVEWLNDEEIEFSISDFKLKHNIDDKASSDTLKTTLNRLSKTGVLKHLGYRRYRKLNKIDDCTTWEENIRKNNWEIVSETVESAIVDKMTETQLCKIVKFVIIDGGIRGRQSVEYAIKQIKLSK